MLLAGSLCGAGLAFGQGLQPLPEELLAMRAEARAYEHGEGVPRDFARAMQLYCEAARLGDGEAPYDLGWMYANGRGTARDDALAAYFFGLAARRGHPQAERMLQHVGEPAADSPACMNTVETAGESEEAGPDLFHDATPAQRKVVDLALRLAPEYGISPRLALAVIRAESNFNSAAVSVKNAQGVMQLIPETAARFNVARPFDPEQNIRGGLAYLRWLLAYFKGNVTLVAAAYNAGEGAVNRFGGIPPFAETRGYVKRIRELFKDDRHPFDPSVAEPSPMLPRILASRLM